MRILPSGGSATAQAGSNLREAMRETWSGLPAFSSRSASSGSISRGSSSTGLPRVGHQIVPAVPQGPARPSRGWRSPKPDRNLLRYGGRGGLRHRFDPRGYFISWRRLRKSIFRCAASSTCRFAVYAVLAWLQPENPILVCAAIVFEYFSYGFRIVGLTLFIMQQVAPGKHQMAHYAFGTSLANLGVMLPGDQRCDQRLDRLPVLLPVVAAGHDPGLPADLEALLERFRGENRLKGPERWERRR